MKVHKIQSTNGTQRIKLNLQKYQLKVEKAVKFKNKFKFKIIFLYKKKLKSKIKYHRK